MDVIDVIDVEDVLRPLVCTSPPVPAVLKRIQLASYDAVETVDKLSKDCENVQIKENDEQDKNDLLYRLSLLKQVK